MPSLRLFTLFPWLRWPMIACLYLSQGVPFGLAMEALPVMLRTQGADLSALAFLPLVGLPWVLKFSWASFVDNHWLAHLGRRRSWMLGMQVLVLACLVVVMLIGVNSTTLPWLIALCALASLASATQDIATDGMVAERFAPTELPQANAIQVAGTMIGFFYGGAFFLLLADQLGTTPALLTLALPALGSLVLVANWREPTSTGDQPERAQASLARFLRRPGAATLLSAALLSAATLVACHGLSKLLLADAGWSMTDIGQLGMAGGAITLLLGCGGGAWLITRFGARRIFAFGLVAACLAALLWLNISRQTALDLNQVWLATALACLGTGMASVAIMTLAMRFAQSGNQAGTDITTVQSMRDLGEIGTSSSLMALAAYVGYSGGFLVGLGLGLLTLAIHLLRPAPDREAR